MLSKNLAELGKQDGWESSFCIGLGSESVFTQSYKQSDLVTRLLSMMDHTDFC